MTFLSPWALLGLAAIVVPVLVHLVRREDREGYPFPSLMFLQRVPMQVRQRRRLRHLGLLALRCLALALIALAFATPFLPSASNDPILADVKHDVVLAIDRSYSMQPEQRWKQAQKTAASAIDALGSDTQAALLVFDSQAVVANEFTQDKLELRQSLERVQPRDQATAYPSAFNLASRLFNESGARTQTLIVVSDLQASAFAAQTLLRLDENVTVQWLPVTNPVTNNLAVMDITVTTDEKDRSKGSLNVLLRNTGTETIRARALTLELDDETRPQESVSLGAGDTLRREIPVVLASDRVSRVTVSTDDDEINADNRLHAIVSQGRRIKVGLINGDSYRQDAGLFIQQAIDLAPNAHLAVDRLRASEWLAQTSDSYDVLILDDVNALAPPYRQKLNMALANGKGIITVAAQYAAFSHDSTGDRQATPVMMEQTPARLQQIDRNHPLAHVLDRRQTRALSGAKVFGYRPVTLTSADTVIARLNNGAPLIIERQAGSGRLLLFTTTLDPRWSSLALEPGFVPLILAAIDHVAQRERNKPAFFTGDTIDIARYAGGIPGAERWRYYLDSGGSVTVETPDGNQETLAKEDEQDTPSARDASTHLFSATDSGFYELHGSLNQNLVVAVNSPRVESLTESLSDIQMTARVSRSLRTDSTQPSQQAITRDASPEEDGLPRLVFSLLLLALLVLLLESWVANRLTHKATQVHAT